MARPTAAARTGTLETRKDAAGKVYYRGRVRLQDGTLTPIKIPEQFIRSKPLAREYVTAEQEIEDEGHAFYLAKVADRTQAEAEIAGAVGETSDAWFVRYVEIHGRLGNGIAQHPGDWRHYVAKSIGKKPIASVTPGDIKAIRDSLTVARQSGKLGAARVMNIWSTVVKAPLSRAFSDDDPKYSSVRVGPFVANPAIGIKPPVDKADKEEDERERQALDPLEAGALLACETIPVATRRFYAWAMLTGLRPAELYGLTWPDVRERVIKVQRARDMKSGADGDTKNRQSVRDVPVHPHLVPLVDAMRGTGRVFPVANVRAVEQHAAELRAHLTLAGITRTELLEGTTTLCPFDVRSFRTCFATWCARSGLDSAWIDVWLGHTPKTTTAKHYVKDTGAMTLGVFPTLPAEVISGKTTVPAVSVTVSMTHKPSELLCEGRDLNPYRSYPAGT